MGLMALEGVWYMRYDVSVLVDYRIKMIVERARVLECTNKSISHAISPLRLGHSQPNAPHPGTLLYLYALAK